jgi:TPR repeat protein
MLVAVGCAKKGATFLLELEKKAEAGDPYAQFNLGNAYYKGNGVPQDYKEAVKWYTKSAEQGFADAQCNLASCYQKGEGVSQDIEEAVKWWKKAAEQRYGY